MNLLTSIMRKISRRSHASRRFASAGLLLPYAFMLFGCSAAWAEGPSTAFFYGSPVPVAALSQYDRVVVEAENLPEPAVLGERTLAFAYLSVGEAEGWRASTRALDAKLFMGKNQAWESRVADLTQPGWAHFLIEQRMAGLWRQGYRAFFLDTLDSYQIAVKDPEGQARQAHALADIVRAMHARFPGVQLLLNRGFDALPEIGHLAVGLAAESLFRGWNAGTKRYIEVDESGRAWLLDKLRTAQSRYQLPVTVIDYVAPQEPALAQETARRIRALGFTPWVATPALDTLGVAPAK